MQTDKRKKILSQILTIAALFLAAIVFAVVVGCPFRMITGIPCPGCGMTRAYLSLLRLDVSAAFHFHPLFPLVPLLAVVVGFCHFVKFDKAKKIMDISIYIMLCAFICVYILRMARVLPEEFILANDETYVVQWIMRLINNK